jgi:hypothetical protein
MSSSKIELGTSFYTKEIISIRCSIISIERENAVKTKFEPNVIGVRERQKFGSNYTVEISGRDEDRVVKAFISLINLFPNTFRSEHTNMSFPSTINTFEGMLDHPRSFGMSFYWNISY